MSKLTRVAALTLATVLMLAGCGGSTHKSHQPVLVTHRPVLTFAQRVALACPPDHSAMGCATTSSPSTKPSFSFSSGAMFPDVYEGQGAVNWASVKGWQQSHGWPVAGIFKVGEYRQDFQSARSAQQTAALGFWRAGYWFVRNTGCTHEANQIVFYFHKLGLHIVALDLEVPEAGGYGACLSPLLKRAGFIVIEYTSPGTNPGGVDTSDPLWQAEYGPTLHPLWHPVVAWQCSDGVFGCVTFVPGVGTDDANVNLGITSLGSPPPDPFAVFPKTVFRFGRDRASEYNTTKTWHDSGCREPAVREVCKTSDYHLRVLLGRIYFIAFNRPVHGGWVWTRPPRWGFPNKQQPLGSRAALIRADLRHR